MEIPTLNIGLLSEAGFFYNIESDSFICVWCDIKLVRKDATVNPWRIHATLSPKCSWVIKVKGKAFVKEIFSIELAERQDGAAADLEIRQSTAALLSDWHDMQGIFNF